MEVCCSLRVQPPSLWVCDSPRSLKNTRGSETRGRLGGSFEPVTCCEFIISPVNDLFSSAFLCAAREAESSNYLGLWRLGTKTTRKRGVFTSRDSPVNKHNKKSPEMLALVNILAGLILRCVCSKYQLRSAIMCESATNKNTWSKFRFTINCRLLWRSWFVAR
jgi:hypothetical protein